MFVSLFVHRTDLTHLLDDVGDELRSEHTAMTDFCEERL